jgi:hypothetical protein
VRGKDQQVDVLMPRGNGFGRKLGCAIVISGMNETFDRPQILLLRERLIAD